MSLRVAVICEDHVLDQYILKPVIEQALAACGRPKAQVRVITSPRVRGFEDLMKQLCELVARYGAIADIVIIAADVDCEDGHIKSRNKPLAVRNTLDACQKHRDRGLIVMAIQELEVWALWGERANLGVPWSTVLEECPQGRNTFDPWPTDRTSNKRDWAPNPDHYPTLKRDKGQLKPWNVRLAHVFCNNQDFGWRMRIRAMLEAKPTMSFEAIAEALNLKKERFVPPGANVWTAARVRKAYRS